MLDNELTQAIGKGLMSNDRLEVLSLKSNCISEEGLSELLEAFFTNKALRLK